MARADKPQKRKTPSEPRPQREGWRLWVRAALSLLVVWHLLVVFLSPLSVPPTSELISKVAQGPWVRWYSDPLYLNHGYHFFGPDPPMGGTHVRWQVFGQDGQAKAEGEFPNLDQQWPRLWYHRHMMLADQMSGVSVYPEGRQNEELMLRAYARHLLRKHEGAEARVESLWHRSLHPADVKAGVDTEDPQLYERGISVTQRASDLDQPLLPPAPAGGAEPEMLPLGGGR